ncbi:16955_t:CDS:2, partial [Cetraspora pellucida]
TKQKINIPIVIAMFVNTAEEDYAVWLAMAAKTFRCQDLVYSDPLYSL